MADKVRFRCPGVLSRPLTLPVWPQDSTNTLPAWNVASLERPRRRALDVPSTRTTEERSLGFTLRNRDYWETVAPLLNDLRTLARSRKAFTLLMGDQDTGLWRMEAPQVTEVAFADDGSPSVVDVSMTLKRASDATINVGLAKRIRGTAIGVSRQR